ncbi:MAG: hypothetical protein Q7S06_03500 [Nanoarchaeota archaeon]|nr:hypothetical protein [Nanoarchaeota archaeon]
MEREKLIKKVGDYFERTRTDPRTERHEPDEEGQWRIIGGITITMRREEVLTRKEISDEFHGTFSNAVAYAVQRDEFWSDCPYRSYLSDGIVKKVHVQELPDSNIPRAICLLRDFGPIVEYK